MESTTSTGPSLEPVHVEATPLESLIAHTGAVAATTTLAEFVQTRFADEVHYVAVERDGEVIGVVSREAVGVLLGGRYGYRF